MTATAAPAPPSTAIPRTMRAAVLVAPGEFRILEKRVPEPGPGQVLVKVAMCGTCGTDLKIMHHPFPGQPPFGEFTPGHEWAGTVVGLGDTVDEFKIGDRVGIEAHSGCMRCDNCILGMYTACLNYGNVAKGHRTSGFTVDGGFAEYVVHHINALYKLPDNVSFEDAVLVTTAGTGLYGIDEAGGFIAGDDIAIIGPGPVGLMTVQLCKALGAGQTILVGTRDDRLAYGTKFGADAVVNARAEDSVAAIRRLTNGLGVDMVIEASGAMDAPQQAVEMVKLGGKILFLAFYKDKVTFDLSRAIRSDVTLHTTRGEGGNNVKRALAMAKQGLLHGRELVTHKFKLDDIQEGFRVVREREGDPIKAVFVP